MQDQKRERNETQLIEFSTLYLKSMSTKISDIREMLNMTNVELSRLSGLSRVTVRRMQNQACGTVKPTMDAFLRVCMVLNIEPSIVLILEDDQRSKPLSD